MAFEFNLDNSGVPEIQGRRRVITGQYTNDGGDTGGDIVTNLRLIFNIQLQPTGSAVNANAPVANETFPLSSGTVTIVTDDGADGLFRIEGE